MARSCRQALFLAHATLAGSHLMIPVEIRALIWTAPKWMIGVARKPWPDGFGITVRLGRLRAVITVKRWWREA
jgi:hypothetical protein